MASRKLTTAGKQQNGGGNAPEPDATPAATDPKPEGKQEDVLIVTSAKSRRRAGFRFGPHETVIRQHQIDEDGIKALDDDPHISIRPGVRTFADED